MTTRKIEVVDYDVDWQQRFAQAAHEIKVALGLNCIDIHHIGSTSVLGLAAKPIIDIIPVVSNLLLVDQQNSAMEAIGYRAKGEFGIPFRRFFQKLNPAVNVHIYEQDNPEIKRHLLFRDYLTQHPTARAEYAALKQKLALLFTYDIDAYISGKYGFIQTIEEKSGFDDCRIVQARLEPEFEHYHRIRKREVFDPVGVEYEKNHWTLTALDHYHFVFFKGIIIIGVLQIELPDATSAIIRCIGVDKPYQNKKYGTQLLQIAEKWIAQQGQRKIYLHARLRALNFYQRAGYHAMPFDDVHRSHPENNTSIDMGKLLS